MEGQKLDLVKETLLFLLTQLKESDRLSLVTYDTNVTTDIPLGAMTAKAKDSATVIIKKLTSGSATNLSGGLLEGLDQMAKKKKNEVASVLLFTDGLANHGVTDTSDIVKAVEKYKSKISGNCTIFTFGYGSDHDAKMLKAIAESGKGIYYYIENADDIPESFADCIGGLLSVVAQNIKLTLEPLNDVTVSELLTHYKHTKEGKKYAITFGDLYSEETRNIVCKVRLPSLSKEAETFEVAKFTLEYFDVISSLPGTASGVIKMSRPETTPKDQKIDVELDKQRNRLETAQAIKEAKEIADRGELETAKKKLATAMGKIKASETANDSYSSNLVSDLEEAVSGMSNQTEYISKGQKKMAWKSQAHELERAVGKGGYETKMKKEMKSKVRKV
jgi:hypothetical protein